MRYICANNTPFYTDDRFDSSFSGIFTNEKVCIVPPLFDQEILCEIGNINDAYIILNNKLKHYRPSNFEELANIMYEVVDEYFGQLQETSGQQRLNYYKTTDSPKISDLKGKNLAMCLERAMLSQNLFRFLRVESTYKASAIKYGDNYSMHSYNIVHFDKYYIFDSSIRTKKDDKIVPNIIEIPQNIYDKVISPRKDIGCSILINHTHAITDEENELIYDTPRKEIYYAKNLDLNFDSHSK